VRYAAAATDVTEGNSFFAMVGGGVGEGG
jgi:hypothetical protein